MPRHTHTPVELASTDAAGSLVVTAGQVQYGRALIPGWFELVGWRDTPDTAVSDTQRPQAHGAYPGEVWADSLAVTYVYRLQGSPEQRLAALRTLEANLPIDGVDRPLVVDDGGGPTFRMARVLQRQVPQEWDFSYVESLECSVQWVCADPRRYALAPTTAEVRLSSSTGGLVYPLTYPLNYGTAVGGARTLTNTGSTPSPFVATFTGPLTDPAVTSDRGWRLAFRLTLAAGEQLVVDTGQGTARLNGDVDRLYTIAPTSSPLERCQIPPGTSTVSLLAAAGTGSAAITFRDAYL